MEEPFEAAPEGAVYGLDEKRRKAATGKAGRRNCNLRSVLLKIIRRAALVVRDRPFHNMRSSRETQLAERFLIQVVTAWLGNTPEVARRHYLQVTDEHFRQATALSRRVDRAAATVRNPW